ncbi:glycosyltransferase [Curtobacterium flaccumfaciens]|uniref:glycosyltransferase n=1 Tax=Curtobacterium flaccumfaciens TaxID=2035 RepID=UPI003F816186
MSDARLRAAIRVIPELRSVHIERFFQFTPAQTYYFDRNFDLGTSAPPPEIVRVSLMGLLIRLVTSSAHVLEVPEPLWMRFLPRWVVICVVWKISGLLRSGPRRIVTYAMENNAFSKLVAGDRALPRFLVTVVRFGVGIVASAFLDRIAFGTPGSAETYQQLPFVRADQELFLELPQARVRGERSATALHRAVFIGSLEARKGILPLMDAWRDVERRMPDAVLTIVGDGPLAAQVRAWVAERPMSRRAPGLLARTTVLELLDDQDVIVLPSVPYGRWREQVGLPIKEGLASGLTVVTTDQTGLAEWLSAHGHEVVPHDASFAGALPNAILRALARPIDRDAVRATLPSRDSRHDADAWMHGVQSQQRQELVVVNPLANALGHYTAALQETLSRGSRSVHVVEIQEPSSGRSRISWVAEYFATLRAARRRKTPVIVLWPVLGYLDAIIMRILIGPNRSALVVHDPRPLVRSVGNGRVARWFAARLGRTTKLLAHSANARGDMREDGFTANVASVPHPVRSTRRTDAASDVETPKGRVVRVLGQYKADRDTDLLTEIATSLDSDVRREIVGRGWPSVPGWNVRSEFVDEAEMDELLRTSDVILIPYRRFYQSGVAIRALEVGTPFVGPRGSSLSDLYFRHGRFLADDDRADTWVESIRLAMDADRDALRGELAAVQTRAASAWERLADEIEHGQDPR